ncbi:hypothetical protein EZS27_002843 [termite gut metagenome]|uniref:DUF4248 domain-containing protein n=1 Tax=termite gut metagenome TaxID=433724 RepID=A0A5J4SVD5_9ZZZZ
MNRMKNTDITESFHIRSYGKGELALMYFPDRTPKTASKSFKKFVDEHPGLLEKLAKTGLKPLSRTYTPAQVKFIIEALGEPG